MTQVSMPLRAGTLTFIATAVLVGVALVGHSLASAAPDAPGVELQPQAAIAQGARGDVITYTLRVTNTDTTGTDSLDIGVSGFVWPTNMLVNGSGTAFLTLPANTGQDVVIEVTIPLTATGSDVARFTATSNNDDSLSVTAVLTTTVQLKTYWPVIRR